jgi:hypothetical protein
MSIIRTILSKSLLCTLMVTSWQLNSEEELGKG